MSFYKFILNAGHFGAGNRHDIAVYIYAKSYITAMNHAKNFPAVKHNNGRAIIKSNVVEEREFVVGILKNAYNKIMYGAKELATLQQNVRTLSYIKDYEFVTDEGKALKDFCDRYTNADTKQKKQVEQEYYTWVQNLINTDLEIQAFK